MLNLENLESSLAWLPAPVLQMLSYVIHRHVGLFFKPYLGFIFLSTLPALPMWQPTLAPCSVAPATTPNSVFPFALFIFYHPLFL